MRMSRYSVAGLDCFQLPNLLQFLKGKRNWLFFAMFCSFDWITRSVPVRGNDRYVFWGLHFHKHGIRKVGGYMEWVLGRVAFILLWKMKSATPISIAGNHHFTSCGAWTGGGEVFRASVCRKDISLFFFVPETQMSVLMPAVRKSDGGKAPSRRLLSFCLIQ